MCISYKEYKEYLKADRTRYGSYNHLKLYFLNVGYKITVHYRRCRFLQGNKYLYALYMFERFRYRSICVKYGCDIPSHSKIGAGLKIDHPVGIVINSSSVIGKNFTIKTGCVVGKKDENGAAVIGNNVEMGAHALIIGHIVVGDNVNIGAGAIVTHDVPNNAIVKGLAASVFRIKNNGD